MKTSVLVSLKSEEGWREGFKILKSIPEATPLLGVELGFELPVASCEVNTHGGYTILPGRRAYVCVHLAASDT